MKENIIGREQEKNMSSCLPVKKTCLPVRHANIVQESKNLLQNKN